MLFTSDLMCPRASLVLAALVFTPVGWLGCTVAEKTEPRPQPENPYTSNAQIESKLLSKDFAPDGDLRKPAWTEAKWESFSHASSGRTDYPQALTEVASRWTTEHLYFAFRCKYSTLNIYEGEDLSKERWELWERDVVEVFINPRPQHVSHYYEFEVAPNNMWLDLEIDKDKDPFNDPGWNSQFIHSTRIDDEQKFWTCEMRIPVSGMNVAMIDPGTDWRVNFFRADGPSGGSERRFLSWSTIPGSKTFHVPARFGMIHFVK